MSAHTPNELHDVFPDAADAIRHFKATDTHFARLAEQHHELNRAIHRAETEIEPASDEHLEDLKKMRLHLLDEIAAKLAEAPGDSAPA